MLFHSRIVILKITFKNACILISYIEDIFQKCFFRMKLI